MRVRIGIRHLGEPIQAFVRSHRRQRASRFDPNAGRDVATQIGDGDDRITGVMIESNLKAGRQDLIPGKELVYGQSITDACLGWEETVPLLEGLAEAVRARRLEHESED